MKVKAHVLAAAAGLAGCAVIAVSVPVLSADRFGAGDRGAYGAPPEAIIIFKERGEPDVDTRGRSASAGNRYSQWPFVTKAYRRPLPDTGLYTGPGGALSFQFGNVGGFFLFDGGAPWSGYAPPYYYERPFPRRYYNNRPRYRRAPVVFNEGTYAPWYRDAPRYRHRGPRAGRHQEPTRLYRSPRVSQQWRPVRVGRQPFRRWGN